MSTVIALHWTDTEIEFAVACRDQIQSTGRVALSPGLDAASVGRRIAEALADYADGKTKAVVALGRGGMEWQLLTLPPCPPDELPDLVRLQIDREVGVGEEEIGFDFLPLVGDEQTPYQVLATSIAPGALDKIRQVCSTAGLELEHVVPLAAGWPALARQGASSAGGTHIFITPYAKQAAIWATRNDKVVLLRQLQLAEAGDLRAHATAMNNELRRTILTLSQQASGETPVISFVGDAKDKLTDLAMALKDSHALDVQVLDLASIGQIKSSLSEESGTNALPLSGLALEHASGKRPLLDVLHPRQRPKASSGKRTYILAGIAAALAALLVGWQGYAKLQAPLEQAAKDQAELTLLEEPLEKLKAYEQRAAAIRNWQAETANTLVHLKQISESIRPQALEAEEFPLDQDIVLDKFLLERRRLTVDAVARNSQAVQPLESRLRAEGYRPERGKSEPSKALNGYHWHFVSTIEIPDSVAVASTEEASE